MNSTEKPRPNSMDLFADESKRHELLTAEEEVLHTNAIQAGVLTLQQSGRPELREVKKLPVGDIREALLAEDSWLDESQKACLQEAYFSRDAMISSNIRWVMKVARQFAYSDEELLVDCVGAGILGLFRAVDGFDASRGFRFSTYSLRSIRQAINEHLAENRYPFRLPRHAYETLAGYVREVQTLESQLMHMPTVEEVAAHLEIEEGQARQLSELHFRQKSLSLTAPFREWEPGAYSPEDVMRDQSQNVEEDVLRRLDIERLKSLFVVLKPRELDILSRHLGLDGRRQETFLEIGQGYGVTQQAASQSYRKALKKLRQAAEERGYVED